MLVLSYYLVYYCNISLLSIFSEFYIYLCERFSCIAFYFYFLFYLESKMYLIIIICRGHNPGGVAILWRTCLDMHAACLNLDIDWLTGIEINYNNQKYVILCVYMPYESHDHEDLFLEHIETLKAIIEDLNTTCIL